MALPPAWIPLLEALNATAWRTGEVERAQDMVKHLEAHGIRVVPSYLVLDVEAGLKAVLREHGLADALAAADPDDEPEQITEEERQALTLKAANQRLDVD